MFFPYYHHGRSVPFVLNFVYYVHLVRPVIKLENYDIKGVHPLGGFVVLFTVSPLRLLVPYYSTSRVP